MEKIPAVGKIVLRAIVVVLFSSAFFWQCANIAPPQGGPRDTLPPRVMGATPEFNTVNFDGTRIFIRFDEYIQLKDQQKEFFTSPPMKRKPTLLVRGQGVQIDIKDTLLENTTYTLNFGSSIQDNNEGNPLHGFRYVFSTGPFVDSMLMSGYAVDAYKKDSVSKALLFFYEAGADSVPQYDSTLFRQPSALARAENNGIFIAYNLKPINYRVYAIQDENDNFTYDPGIDKVAFLDGSYNPRNLPPFDGWFDTTRMYMTAEPQLYFRLFMDKRFKRQNLTEQKRPLQHKLELLFNAPYPQIDTLVLEGIDSTRIITEYLTPGRDTIALWLNVPGEELPDTIKGRISYLRHDSLNQLTPHSERLSFFWKYIETREEQRERERLERERERALRDSTEFEEPVVPNPFKAKINAGSTINPEHNLTMEFDYPLVSMDSARISLLRLADDERLFRVRYELQRDSANIRKWVLRAPWAAEEKYRLDIPAGVFLNSAGQTNDTIRQEFTILSPDKYGTLTVNLTGKTDTSSYVLQLLDAKDALLQEKPFSRTGTHTFRYISPGDVKLRVVEDMNDNGKWDPGDLIARIQPERVEVYIPESGNELLTMKVNWEIEIAADMNELFKPIDIFDVRRQIEKSEQLRTQRLMEERAKRRAQPQNQNQTPNQQGTQPQTMGPGIPR